MSQTLGILVGIAVVAIILVFLYVINNLKVCQPNEVLVFSGRKRKLPDGTTVGYRIMKGGRGLRLPIVETVSRMSLTTMPIQVGIKGALCKGIIPIDVEGIANVKIAGTEGEGLGNAIERFLGKNVDDIAQVARETLEGNMRGVLATMTAEEANSERLAFAEQVSQQLETDFRRLGLVLDTFKIQNVSDQTGYLEAVGRKKNAEVRRDARIVEADADAEATLKSSDAKRRGRIAEVEAQRAIIEVENQLRIREADLAADVNRASEKAKIAGEIMRVSEAQKLERERVEMNQKKYEADVVVPARAEKAAEALRAVGRAANTIEEGKATAEAIRVMRKEWEKEDTRELFLIQQLPAILDTIVRGVTENMSIEKLTIVDSGNGNGIPTYVKGITGTIVTILEQVKNATGLDVVEILQPEDSNNAQIPRELS